MRKELGKECRKLFRKMMSTELPQYREDKWALPQGRYVWSCDHQSGTWFHILLVIHHSQDKFTIEGGWSFDGKRPPPSYAGAGEILVRPVTFRPGFIWSGKDYWWLLVLRPEEHERVIGYKDDPVEQCLPLVAPAVADAAQKIKDYVLPTFRKIAEIHGKKSVQ